MGKSQREKGNRFERQTVAAFNDAGIPAKRVPLSGATWLKGDVLIDNEIAECKKRGDGFKQLYQWIEEARYLIVAADRKEPLVVVRQDDFIRLLLGQKDRD